jgi:hypothetical protein
MIVECTNCHTAVDAEPNGSFNYGAGDENNPGRFLLLRCRVCGSPLLVEQEASSQGGLDKPIVLYPQPEMRVNPQAPRDIRAAVEEGIKCYQVQAFTAAAIMCRKALEGVCEAHGVKERSLDTSLKKMLETEMIDKRLYDWSDQLRIAGNEAAHGVGSMSSAQDARDVLDFTIGIIDYLFSYRDQFEKFKQRRAKGNAA